MALVTWIFGGLKRLLTLVALPWTALRSTHVGPRLRWALHGVLLVAVLVGLGFANYFLGFDALVRAPHSVLRLVWLPLIFALSYALAWLGWWLYRLSTAPPEPAEFPDLDEAWQEATDALARAGMDWTSAPVFLLLGSPAGSEAALFHAAGLPLSVPQSPRSPEAPLHLFANSDGIYLSCPGASLLAEQAKILTAELPLVSSQSAGSPSSDDLDQSAFRNSHSAFLPVPDMGLKSQPWPTENAAWSHSHAESEGNQAVAVLDAPPAPIPAAANPAMRADRDDRRRERLLALRHEDQLECISARLRHVCRTIVAVRKPYCPINGILALVPYAATEADDEANQAAILLERDLRTVRDATQVECPLVTLVCDLERDPGCREFLNRFPTEQRRRRLGVELPAVPPCDAEQRSRVIATGIHWICQVLMPRLIYRLLDAPQATETDGPAQQGNVLLYRFLETIRDRHARLSRILTRALGSSQSPAWQLRGCFLAATGTDATREQGFLATLFPQLLAWQNDVSWSDAAANADVRYHRWTRWGYAGLGIGSAALLALACAF